MASTSTLPLPAGTGAVARASSGGALLKVFFGLVLIAVTLPHWRGPLPTLSSFAPFAPARASTASSLFANHGKAVLASWTRRSSAHVCVYPTEIEVFFNHEPGDPQKFTSAHKRTCVFRNLCWSGAQFVYFRDAEHPVPFEHANSRGPIFEPSNPFLELGNSMHHYGNFDDWMRLSVEDGEIPSSYGMADDAESVHLLIRARAPGNVGHELADSTWPAFNAMLDTGMLAVDNQLVFIEPDASDGKLLRTPESSRTHGSLSLRPVRNMSSYPAGTCFPWAVAGNGGRSLPSPSLPSAFSWRVLHDFVLERYKLTAPTPRMSSDDASIRILVKYKRSRHSWTNYDTVLSELKRCYPSATVTLFKPEQLPTFRNELEVLADTDVYITPGGGGSFTSMFLPTNAAVIYTASCWPAANGTCSNEGRTAGGACCVQHDRHIWSNVPHLHISYYSYTGPTSGMVFEGPYWFPQTGWDYPIETPELFKLVDRGLFLSKGRSYNRC